MKVEVNSSPASQIEGRKAHEAIELSDGRTAVVHRGVGRDSIKIELMAGTDASRYFPCAMHYLVSVDGQRMPAEDFEELDMADFNKIVRSLNVVMGNG